MSNFGLYYVVAVRICHPKPPSWSVALLLVLRWRCGAREPPDGPQAEMPPPTRHGPTRLAGSGMTVCSWLMGRGILLRQPFHTAWNGHAIMMS
jgi:hypothetical protein